ncbi:MAG TPA: DUF2254 family protein [Candidatus Dormibacteraeota bacterium]|nr:DUF2254 family protein [Candidatus Dormibacteraeota bacterium]
MAENETLIATKRSAAARLPASIIVVLPGIALIAFVAMLVILFGFLDASHYTSLTGLFTPDPAAAAGTVSVAGGAEGVTLSIVILVVFYGIQTTSSRYSPRIIDIFTRNPLNALVFMFALASILYTFLVRAEIKPGYVPMWSVTLAVVFAVANFAILLPYVIYIFDIMRAESLIKGIRRRATRDIRRTVNAANTRKYRDGLMTCVAQVTDIVFGSIQLGDMPVSVYGVETLGHFLADDYLRVKKKLKPDWFQVGHADMPGASDQIVAEVNRARTWVEYSILSSFVEIVGLTPIHRKEAVHAIALATRDVGLAAIEVGDPEVANLSMRFFNTYLRSAINRDAPTFASVMMNEYRRFAIGALEWRPDLSVDSASHLLRYGRHFDQSGMPAVFGAAAEDVADLAIEAQGRDPEVTRRLALLLVRNLSELLPTARPIGLNGLFKAVAKLAFWALEVEATDVSSILVEGIAAAPQEFVDGALDRMESMSSGLFWEVNERVIAFDWVEEPLRAQIPRLRAALKRAKEKPSLEEETKVAAAAVKDTAEPELARLPALPAPPAALDAHATNGSSTPGAPQTEPGVASATP